MATDFQIAAARYTSPDVLQRAPSASKPFASSAVDPKTSPHLKKVLQPTDPIKVDGPKAKLPSIDTGRPQGSALISSVGDHLSHQGKSGILGDCLDVGCKALTAKTNDVAPVLANQLEAPAVKDPAIAAQDAAREDNTQYTKVAEQNFDMPSPPGMA